MPKMSKAVLWERYHPYLLGVIAFAVAYYSDFHIPSVAIVQPALTISAVLIGFITTNNSIIVASNSEIAIALKAAKQRETIIDYSREAIYVALAFCCISGYAFFLDDCFNSGYSSLWLGFLVASVCLFLRTVNILIAFCKKV